MPESAAASASPAGLAAVKQLRPIEQQFKLVPPVAANPDRRPRVRKEPASGLLNILVLEV